LKLWPGLLAGLGLSLALACGPGPPREISGPDLARRLGCFACHVLNGQGGRQEGPQGENRAPSLDGIGARLSLRELETSLSHPRRRHPGARMPSYDYLRPQEKQALLDFLGGLR
jgi:hypothetical protein